jgi:hypothetical protein
MGRKKADAMTRRQNHDTETGVRIKLTDGPWPERNGCRGTIVTGSMNPNVYPRHALGKTECIILLDDDPLGATRKDVGHDSEWTCVVDKSDVWRMT